MRKDDSEVDVASLVETFERMSHPTKKAQTFEDKLRRSVVLQRLAKPLLEYQGKPAVVWGIGY